MEKYILFAGRKIPIYTNYPVNLFANDSAPSFYNPRKTLSEDKLTQMMSLRPELKNYSSRAGNKHVFSRSPEQLYNVSRNELDALGQFIHQIALHHDVTTNAIDTFNVLCSRGLSTHFVVNYDGALYQFMDCYHVAWATGDNNTHSIAIDMNNPVYPELMNSDPAAGMRDIYQGNINGSVKTMLGYTEPQYETIIALIKAFITPIKIPGEDPWTPLPIVAQNCFPPISENGEVINRLLKDSINFQGFLGHYHCSANKWDPGPAFDWMRVLSGIKGKRNSLPLILNESEGGHNLSGVGGSLLESLFNQYYTNAEHANGGWYPLGTNQSWHSGIHLTAPKDTPVLNMMDGTIVAIRNVRTVDLGDPSFVLIRHEREENDASGKPQKVFWYSLYMHLEPMFKKEQFLATPWVTDLLDNDIETPDSVLYNVDLDLESYIRGIPKVIDGTAKSKNHDDIVESFFKGDIILVNIPCDAETRIGTVGQFGHVANDLTRQVHIEVFSDKNIFQHGNAQGEAWSIIEGDTSDYSLVRIKKLLKPIHEYVQYQTGRTPTILKSSEIQNFYSLSTDDPLATRRDSFRRMICYHRSEWSPKMNWTRTAVQSVGWQWESEDEFGRWLLLWLPFQWLTDELTKALDLPEDHRFFTFHPIYLLRQLNLTYSGDISQTAEEASDDEFERNANELAQRVNDLVELNQKFENKEPLTQADLDRREELYQLMDDHLDDKRADVKSETKYNYYYDNSFDEWEPGEWNPPEKSSLKDLY